MAVETFFPAHWRFARYELEMATLASHFGLFNGLVGDGLLVWLSFFFLGLQRPGRDLVAKRAFCPFNVEFCVLEMAKKTFFDCHLKMFFLCFMLMAGGAVECLAFYLFLRVIMFVMGKLNNPF
jgi:hypothetical protein